MKIKEYLFDKLSQTIVFAFGYIATILFLKAFKVGKPLIIAISFVFAFMYITIIAIDYLRKQKFYNNLVQTVDGLDKKYLVLEMINKPDFYEGKIFYQTLYEINKSMIEKVKEYSLSIADFKEYVEMWIHEVKIPISSLILLNHNHKNSLDSKYVKQIRKLDNYIDQILYYVRSENAEKDYIIKGISLNDIIKNVALKNKDDLLENNVDLIVDVSDEKVLTDSKWLEFILNQIINNSIKYKRDNIDSYIKIKTYENTNSVKLFVEDNGIGIPKNDLGQVFNKCFTGENGREKSKSTGMGLYIAKKLCTKLGHRIEIESEAVKLKNPWLCIIIFMVSACALGYSYYVVTEGINEVLSTNKRMLAIIAIGSISTFFIFWSLSGLILKIVKSNKKFYYKGLNSFTVRQVSSKINTTVFSVTVICLMLFITICVLSSALSMKNSLNRSFESYAPRDVELSKRCDIDEDLKDYGYTDEQIEGLKMSIKEILGKLDFDYQKYFKNIEEYAIYTNNEVNLKSVLGDYYENASSKYSSLIYDHKVELMKLR